MTDILEKKRQRDLEHAYQMLSLDAKEPLEKLPAYTFSPGEEVRIGNLEKVTIEKAANPQKTLYEVKVEHKGEISWDVFPWYKIRYIRSLEQLPERIGQENSIRIFYNNSTIESLLHHYYNFGINCNPDYQREFVWAEADREYLLDSVFSGVDIGKFTLIRKDDSEDVLYEILDGKQRLTTLVDFYESRFPYKGLHFHELHPLDQKQFLSCPASVGELQNMEHTDILKAFLALNRGGVTMSREHLNQVEEMLEEELIEQEQEEEMEEGR